jgi:hypothetical protein
MREPIAPYAVRMSKIEFYEPAQPFETLRTLLVPKSVAERWEAIWVLWNQMQSEIEDFVIEYDEQEQRDKLEAMEYEAQLDRERYKEA